MKHHRVIAVLVVVACLWVGCNSAFAAALVWQETTKATVVAMAKSQGKKILLVAGRYPACSRTENMRDTVCESVSPPIKSLIEKYFIPWYIDIDSPPGDVSYYANYAGYVQYMLPLIAVIDPNNSNTYLDRTTDWQDPQTFHSRLLKYAYTQELIGDINNSGQVDLADVILAIQISAGISSTDTDINADVNNDQKIGIVEAIYTLQKVAGLR
jgi:hypothetical protein